METVNLLRILQSCSCSSPKVEKEEEEQCVLLFSMHYFQAVSTQQIYYDLNATISQVFVCVCVCYLPVVTVRQKNEDRQTERMRVGDTCVCVCVGVDAQCWQLPSCRLCDNTLLNTVLYICSIYSYAMPWYVHFHFHKFVINLHKYFGCT